MKQGKRGSGRTLLKSAALKKGDSWTAVCPEDGAVAVMQALHGKWLRVWAGVPKKKTQIFHENKLVGL